MITERILRGNPALIKALTGLPADDFWQLIEELEAKFPEYERQRHERLDRQRAVGAGHPYAQSLVLRAAAVLTYMRLHIPQEVIALFFGTTQPYVSRDLRRLLPLIVQLIPAPEVWEIMDEEKELTEKEVLGLAQLADGRALVDATEQPVYRSQDNEERKKYYSGKKKAFTLKTEFVTDGEHHILAVSEAVPGATHDKRLSDEIRTLEHLPDGCEVEADKGYQGLDKQVTLVVVRNPETVEEQQVPRLHVKTPFKKPKGGELTEEQEEFNRLLGAVRVRVEHCIGWVKNWAIIATRFRCAHSIYTLIMRVVCGFVNLQTARWQKANAQAMA